MVPADGDLLAALDSRIPIRVASLATFAVVEASSLPLPLSTLGSYSILDIQNSSLVDTAKLSSTCLDSYTQMIPLTHRHAVLGPIHLRSPRGFNTNQAIADTIRGPNECVDFLNQHMLVCPLARSLVKISHSELFLPTTVP